MAFDHKLRAVIFDIDNTLYDFTGTNSLAVTAVAEYAEKSFGWPAEEFKSRYASVQKRILEACGMNGSCRNRILRFQTILEEAGLPLSPHAIAMYDLYWDTLIENMTPFEGAEDAMATAAELGLRIGICTDMTAYSQFRKLEKMKLLRYVDFMAASEEAGVEKPSPEIFALCIRKAGCLPEECIFIGDHP
ncbi:MAG: HAD family hydrolase, partial [Lachnospiraceae bacterium]|nr:HAD family hydrolase [Lachnospiraceae bacterium]